MVRRHQLPCFPVVELVLEMGSGIELGKEIWWNMLNMTVSISSLSE